MLLPSIIIFLIVAFVSTTVPVSISKSAHTFFVILSAVVFEKLYTPVLLRRWFSRSVHEYVTVPVSLVVSFVITSPMNKVVLFSYSFIVSPAAIFNFKSVTFLSFGAFITAISAVLAACDVEPPQLTLDTASVISVVYT